MDYERFAAAQHGVVTGAQLLGLGMHPQAVTHRLAVGRLHAVHRGVYAVGAARLDRWGQWLAAVLCCGPGAALSHEAAAVLWGILDEGPVEIDVSIESDAGRRSRPGVRVHRRAGLRPHVRMVRGVSVVSPAWTLVDLASRLAAKPLEAAVNAADRLDLLDPETLRRQLARMPRRRGVARLATMLDRHTFVLTDSELERRFLPLAKRAGLPRPQTGRRLNGFRVDFFWPALGLVVETDGLRYHRTAAAQTRDRLRDQAHTAAGLTPPALLARAGALRERAGGGDATGRGGTAGAEPRGR